MSENLVQSYSYKNSVISDAKLFRQQLLEKSIIPYQVEFQPPPASLRKICWLECDYCYGASADDSASQRMDKKLALSVLKDIAVGGVKKVIFAGYATDPLNSPFIEDLLESAIDHELIFGFNTKALRISKKLYDLISRSDIQESSYVSLSVDAGTNETYNAMHSVASRARIYDKVLDNARKLRLANPDITLSAAYLINRHNDSPGDVKKFIEDFRSAGCNYLRFSFLQQPKDVQLNDVSLPDETQQEEIKTRLSELISNEDSEDCPVKLVDIDKKENIYRKARTVPCFARFIFPTVGYDGWLYNCSQSSSPNFHSTALGDLSKKSFWDLYYNYDLSDEKRYFHSSGVAMKMSGCRCDRKMHLANKNLIETGLFKF